MADQHGTPPESLDRLQELRSTPQSFSFAAAIRLLDCLLKSPTTTGKANRPSLEGLRIGQTPSLNFAPSSLASIQQRNDGKMQVQTYFLGLFGPNGPLPIHISDFAEQRIKHHRDTTFAAFVDTFHHRMASFFYRAWAESQPTVHMDRKESDRFSSYVASLFGIGMAPLRDRNDMPDHAKLFFAAHFASQTKHGYGLKSVLAAFFKVNTELLPFVSHWVPLPDDCTWRLGLSPANSTNPQCGSLGRSVTIGARVRDCQQKFRLVLGPLDFQPFCKLLPNGESMKRLRSIVDQYVGMELSWDVQLVLKKEHVPRLRLGRDAQLGWTTWISSRTPKSDADELIVSPTSRSKSHNQKPASKSTRRQNLEPFMRGI